MTLKRLINIFWSSRSKWRRAVLGLPVEVSWTALEGHCYLAAGCSWLALIIVAAVDINTCVESKYEHNTGYQR
jgi:lysylphosphatidylglycerol synthetase-like protein (DUF2156 family)